MNFLKKIILTAVAITSTMQIEISASPNNIHAPIYHPDGNMAWTGYETSPFHYDNYSIVWAGLKNPKSLISYKSGEKAWEGFFYRDFPYHASLRTVYHLNGKKAWGGASASELFCDKECSVYHDNGERAWRGVLGNECFLTYMRSTLYYNNGVMAWRGGIKKDFFYTDTKNAYIYHTNGGIAWRGGFAKDGGSEYSNGIYYSSGELAWSGKPTDPIYDKAGNITTGRADFITLDLGNCSTLHVHSNGFMQFFLGLGNSSSLIFTNNYCDPELLIALDYPAYVLIFNPHSSKKPARFVAYNKTFLIK